MTWWDALMVLGVSSGAVGVMGAVVTLMRQLPWGIDWHVGGYP